LLVEPKIKAFLPTINAASSKLFYMNTVGLKLVSEDNYALEFAGHGTSLRITTVQELNPQPFTVLGFMIEKIEAQVNSLIDKGVIFERYDSLNQDALGIWTSPSKAKIAWFKDPDGNIISLTQSPTST